MITLESIKQRFANDYEFIHGTLSTRVNSSIDVTNGVIPGDMLPQYKLAMDQKTGLNGVVDTEAKPMQFIPTIPMNHTRMRYLEQFMPLFADLKVGYTSAISIGSLMNAPGFDTTRIEILRQYQLTGYLSIIYTVVYESHAYGVHLLIKGLR